MRRLTVLALLVGVGTAAIAARAQERNAVRVQTLDVSDNLYLLSGGGGNTLALVLEAGVVLVDTKLPGWGPAILEGLAAVTDKPVTVLINTHSHGDHTGSNGEFASVVEVVAHSNTRAAIERTGKFTGAAARFLPNRTFEERLTLFDGIDRIELYYFGRGHTDGDAVVVFPAKRVAHMGDLFPARAAPFIDTASGGSGVAYPETLSKAVAALDGVTRVVTGHGATPPGSPITRMTGLKDLAEYADFTRDFLAAVRDAMAAGRSAEDAARTLAMPERYKDYDMSRAGANVEAIYGELRASAARE